MMNNRLGNTGRISSLAICRMRLHTHQLLQFTHETDNSGKEFAALRPAPASGRVGIRS